MLLRGAEPREGGVVGEPKRRAHHRTDECRVITIEFLIRRARGLCDRLFSGKGNFGDHRLRETRFSDDVREDVIAARRERRKRTFEGEGIERDGVEMGQRAQVVLPHQKQMHEFAVVGHERRPAELSYRGTVHGQHEHQSIGALRDGHDRSQRPVQRSSVCAILGDPPRAPGHERNDDHDESRRSNAPHPRHERHVRRRTWCPRCFSRRARNRDESGQEEHPDRRERHSHSSIHAEHTARNGRVGNDGGPVASGSAHVHKHGVRPLPHDPELNRPQCGIAGYARE